MFQIALFKSFIALLINELDENLVCSKDLFKDESVVKYLFPYAIPSTRSILNFFKSAYASSDPPQ